MASLPAEVAILAGMGISAGVAAWATGATAARGVRSRVRIILYSVKDAARNLADPPWRNRMEPLGGAHREDRPSPPRRRTRQRRRHWPLVERTRLRAGSLESHGTRARHLPRGRLWRCRACRRQPLRMGLRRLRRPHDSRYSDGTARLVAVARWRAERRDHRAGGGARRSRAGAGRDCRWRYRALRPRPYIAHPHRMLARTRPAVRKPLRVEHGFGEHARLRTRNARHFLLESFAFGMTRLTRTGFAPGCTLPERAMGCSASTADTTRAGARLASTPLSTATCGEGR